MPWLRKKIMRVVTFDVPSDDSAIGTRSVLGGGGERGNQVCSRLRLCNNCRVAEFGRKIKHQRNTNLRNKYNIRNCCLSATSKKNHTHARAHAHHSPAALVFRFPFSSEQQQKEVCEIFQSFLPTRLITTFQTQEVAKEPVRTH